MYIVKIPMVAMEIQIIMVMEYMEALQVEGITMVDIVEEDIATHIHHQQIVVKDIPHK